MTRGAIRARCFVRSVVVVALTVVLVGIASVSEMHGQRGPHGHSVQVGHLGPAQPVSASRPVLPVTPSLFRVFAKGTVPRGSVQRIPNWRTPTGAALSRLPGCNRTFRTADGATASEVNRAIVDFENALSAPMTICLSGIFRAPIHVWGKFSPALLTIRSLSSHDGVIEVGRARSDDVQGNEFDSVAGAVSVVDSRDVAIDNLAVTGYWARGIKETPAGIYVEERAKGFGGCHRRALPMRIMSAKGSIFFAIGSQASSTVPTRPDMSRGGVTTRMSTPLASRWSPMAITVRERSLTWWWRETPLSTREPDRVRRWLSTETSGTFWWRAT